MQRVIWSDGAVSNLEAIVAYVESFSPLAAQRLGLRLINAADSLAVQAGRGRGVSSQVRELTVIRPYIIRYRIVDEAVFILRIRHGARRP